MHDAAQKLLVEVKAEDQGYQPCSSSDASSPTRWQQLKHKWTSKPLWTTATAATSSAPAAAPVSSLLLGHDAACFADGTSTGTVDDAALSDVDCQARAILARCAGAAASRAAEDWSADAYEVAACDQPQALGTLEHEALWDGPWAASPAEAGHAQQMLQLGPWSQQQQQRQQGRPRYAEVDLPAVVRRVQQERPAAPRKVSGTPHSTPGGKPGGLLIKSHANNHISAAPTASRSRHHAAAAAATGRLTAGSSWRGQLLEPSQSPSLESLLAAASISKRAPSTDLDYHLTMARMDAKAAATVPTPSAAASSDRANPASSTSTAAGSPAVYVHGQVQAHAAHRAQQAVLERFWVGRAFRAWQLHAAIEGPDRRRAEKLGAFLRLVPAGARCRKHAVPDGGQNFYL